MSTAEVAVAVVSWNTRSLLDACLRSLRADADAGRAEVWVVDNGSTDGSPALVREEHPWARLLEPDGNIGFGAAVNLVADATDTPWVAAANADVALAPGALERLLATGAQHPRAGAVAPRLVLPGGATQHGVFPFPTLPFTLAFNGGLHLLVPAWGRRVCLHGAWEPERPRVVPWAVGALLLVRRRAFADAGGFDPAQWMYAEDLDLGWRLRRAGWVTRYEPAARVAHAESAAATLAFGEARTDRWQEATYAWMLRRLGPTRTAVAAVANVAGAMGRAAWPRGPRAQHLHWARRHAVTARAAWRSR